MLAAVSKAPVLAKEHLAPIMPAENFAAQEAWSALHPLFGSFRLAATETKQLCSQNRNQSRKLGKFTDELGLRLWRGERVPGAMPLQPHREQYHPAPSLICPAT